MFPLPIHPYISIFSLLLTSLNFWRYLNVNFFTFHLLEVESFILWKLNTLFNLPQQLTAINFEMYLITGIGPKTALRLVKLHGCIENIVTALKKVSVLSCPDLSWPVLPCHTLFCSALPCPVLFCPALSYPLLFCTVLHHSVVPLFHIF